MKTVFALIVTKAVIKLAVILAIVFACRLGALTTARLSRKPT